MIIDDILHDYIQLTDDQLVGSRARNIPTQFIIHHTGGTDDNPLADTSNHTFEMVDAYHKEKWGGLTKSSIGNYIGYHLFIEKNGKVTLGRAITDIGAHTVGQNDRSIAICLAGNFDATMPTEAQIRSLRLELAFNSNMYRVPRVAHPHRHYAVKSCYGKKLSDSWAQDLFKESVVSSPPKEIKVTIPTPAVTTTQSSPASPTFNLFAYLYNLCRKLFKR